VSQLGMLAGTLVYVNAGTQLAQLDSLSGILSPGLVASFALLGVFPWLAKRSVTLVQARKVYAAWPKPRRFDRNLVVIGAGSRRPGHRLHRRRGQGPGHPGRTASLGGDCLNTGCVPSKALIRTATLLAQLRRVARLRHPQRRRRRSISRR
jgi:hypothetical protein